MQTLRPYQTDAIRQLDEAAEMGLRRAVCCVPTGGGKTTIAASLIHRAEATGKRVLFLAHRKELVDQCGQRLDQHGVDHGVIMAGTDRRNTRLPVQVASVQTLVRRHLPPADLIFVDECHLSCSPTFRLVIDAYPEAQVVGLTATPWRLDGKGLGQVYDVLIDVVTPAELITEGHLVQPRIMTTPVPDLSAVKSRSGDYDTKGLAAAMDRADLVGDVVGHWLAHARGRRTVVFAVNVEHSVHLVERFREAGITAEHLDANTPDDKRKAILTRLRSGETQVVSNVEILTAGWDLPALEVCVLARPTQSLSLYLQMVGRVMRPAPGKPGALILDHAGGAHEHGTPWDERDWSLVGPRDNARKRAATQPLTTCMGCYAIWPTGTTVCGYCGYQIRGAGGDGDALPTTAAGSLVEFTGKANKPRMEDKRRRWLEIVAQADRMGRSKGWAAHRYKEEFGVWPRMPRQGGVS